MQYIRTYIKQETWDDLPIRAQEVLQKHLKGITVIPNSGEFDIDEHKISLDNLVNYDSHNVICY